jgi:hypothetical protein
MRGRATASSGSASSRTDLDDAVAELEHCASWAFAA